MKATPSLVPIVADEYTKGDDNLLQLVQRKESWGEFSKRGRDIAIAGTAALQAETQHITTVLQASHEAELARAQAALQTFALSMQAVGRAMQAYGAGMQSNHSVNCTAFSLPRAVSTAPQITNMNCN
jgi:hypothetical protein